MRFTGYVVRESGRGWEAWRGVWLTETDGARATLTVGPSRSSHADALDDIPADQRPTNGAPR